MWPTFKLINGSTLIIFKGAQRWAECLLPKALALSESEFESALRCVNQSNKMISYSDCKSLMTGGLLPTVSTKLKNIFTSVVDDFNTSIDLNRIFYHLSQSSLNDVYTYFVNFHELFQRTFASIHRITEEIQNAPSDFKAFKKLCFVSKSKEYHTLTLSLVAWYRGLLSYRGGFFKNQLFWVKIFIHCYNSLHEHHVQNNEQVDLFFLPLNEVPLFSRTKTRGKKFYGRGGG